MAVRSFIDISPDSHFPLENLPFGVFEPKQGKPRVGVAIGDLIIDLSVLEEIGHFRSPEFENQNVFSKQSLNSCLALGRPAWRKTRQMQPRQHSARRKVSIMNWKWRSRLVPVTRWADRCQSIARPIIFSVLS